MKKKKMFKNMNKMFVILIAAVFLTLGLAGRGIAETVKCDADADTFTNACYGGCLFPQGCPTEPMQKNCRMHVRTFRTIGAGHGSKNQRAMIKFDISDIPANATINRVELGVRYFGHCAWTDPVGRSIGVYRMTDPNADGMWDECTAMWIYRSDPSGGPIVDWASNNNPDCPFPNGFLNDPCHCGGGDFDDVNGVPYGDAPYASAAIVDSHAYIDESSVWMRFYGSGPGSGLVQLVDGWVNGGAPNHGVILRDTDEIWVDMAQSYELAPLWFQTRTGDDGVNPFGEYDICRHVADGWIPGNDTRNVVPHGGPYLIVTYNQAGALPDSDSDGVPDVYDNCRDTANGPLIGPYDAANNRQYDTDADGWGNACDCDLDNNFPPGVVGFGDLTDYFIPAWGSQPGDPSWNRDADFNSNDVVGMTDLTEHFVVRWGTQEPWF